jgi:hypothetical protein
MHEVLKMMYWRDCFSSAGVNCLLALWHILVGADLRRLCIFPPQVISEIPANGPC